MPVVTAAASNWVHGSAFVVTITTTVDGAAANPSPAIADGDIEFRVAGVVVARVATIANLTTGTTTITFTDFVAAVGQAIAVTVTLVLSESGGDVTYTAQYSAAVVDSVSVSATVNGDDTEQTLAKDLDLQIPAETASTSNLVFTLRRCVNAAVVDVEIDSASGLRIVSGVDAPAAGDGSVVRDSDSQVTVHLAADAYDHLRPGGYALELHEITLVGRVSSRYTQTLYLTRSASRRMQ